MTLQKVFYYATITTMFLISVLIIAGTIIWTYPYKIMELNSIRVLNHPKPGESIDLFIDACKYKETHVNMTYTLFYVQTVSEYNPIKGSTESAKISRRISESYVSTSTGQAGCESFIDPTVSLPPDALPGEYEILITLAFEINKFKDVQYRYKVGFTL